MNFRTSGTLAAVAIGVVLLFLPGRGLLGPMLWFGHRPNPVMMILMSLVIFCAVYFGTLKFWELLTGDKLQKPLPAILALGLAVRLTVDCARMMMWW